MKDIFQHLNTSTIMTQTTSELQMLKVAKAELERNISSLIMDFQTNNPSVTVSKVEINKTGQTDRVEVAVILETP